MKKIDKLRSRKDLKQGNIMKIGLNSTSKEGLLAKILGLLSHAQKFYIVTPNPEIILLAQKDRKLMQILNNADLAIPDGVGLKLANRSLKIIKGREIFMSLMSLANKKSWKIFLLGGLGKEAEISKQKLEISYKKIRLQAFTGPKLNEQAEPISEDDRTIQYDTIKRINEFAPKILFVGFGAPKQEKWIYKWLPKLNVGGAMTVGGTFSYLAGHRRLPPKWVEKAGLEWLWRLLTEPQRLGRIFRAVIVFPIKVLIAKFITAFKNTPM